MRNASTACFGWVLALINLFFTYILHTFPPRHAVALLRGLAHELGQAESFEGATLFVQTGAQVRASADAHVSIHPSILHPPPPN